LIGLVECLVVGWLYNVNILRRHANSRSDWKIGVWWEWLIKYITPLVLGTLFVWSLIDKFTKKEGFLVSAETGKPIWPNIVGLTLMFIVLVAAVILSRVGRTDYRINEVKADV